MKRPFVLFAIFLSFGILTAGLSESTAFIFYISMAICVINVIYMLYINVYEINKIISIILFAVFFFTGGYILLNNEKKNFEDFARYHDMSIKAQGIVSSVVVKDGGRIEFIFTSEIINGQKKKGRIEVFIYGEFEGDLPEFNDRLVLTGIFSFPDKRKNPGGMDYRRYMYSNGNQGSMFVFDPTIESFGDSNYHNKIMVWGNSIRKSIYESISENMTDVPASILIALLTGINNIENETKNNLQDSGLIHITAVSGLHISILVSFLLTLIAFTGIHKKAGTLIIIVILGFYMIVTGFSNSVIRSVIMTTAAMTGQLLNRENDSFTTLSATYTIMLLNNPHRLYNSGFVLSFTAALSIVFLAKKIIDGLISKVKSKNMGVKYMLSAAGVTAAAQIGTLPFLLLYFNKFSMVSIIANLFVTPLTGPAIAAGFCFYIISAIIPAASSIAAYIAEMLINIIVYVSEIFSKLPFATIRSGISSYVLIPIYYTVLAYIFFFKEKIRITKKHFLMTSIAAIILYMVFLLLPSGLEVVYLDVGAGDSIFICTPQGKNILIDGGGTKPPDSEDEDTGERIVLPFLYSRGIRKIDFLIVTHGHNDHVNGILTVLKHFKAGALILPDYTEADEFDELIKLAVKKKVPVYRLNDNSKIKVDNSIEIRILNPPRDLVYTSLNNSSLVIELVYGDVGFLFVGDAEYEAERYIMDNNTLCPSSLRVLKVGHHGSITSTSEEFLDFADPFMAVISTGRNNHGHPDPVVLERLNDYGCNIYRTDHNGAITVNTDGKKLKVKVMID